MTPAFLYDFGVRIYTRSYHYYKNNLFTGRQMYSNLKYNKYLKQRARKLRKDSTQAEIRLWCELLRAHKMGYPFLRQRPVLYYIADFLCKPLQLIIEVDGFTHEDPQKWEKDKKRQKDLEDSGFCVIRFKDDEIMTDLENVDRKIREVISLLENN